MCRYSLRRSQRAEDAAQGFLVGEEAPDVVETSKYREALAAMEAEAGPSDELVVELLSEPDIQYDRVRVVAGGHTIGCLSRSDAAAASTFRASPNRPTRLTRDV